MELQQLIIYLGAFGIVAVAAYKMVGMFQKVKLPLITGFLVIGLVSGPEILDLIEAEALENLDFVNEIALAFIAFAVGSELYLKELRSRFRSIIIMIAAQVAVIFAFVSVTVFLLLDFIPFAEEMKLAARIAVSMLAGTIAIGRSPASAIAVINELRARGPFTQTSLGVIVMKDFGVIISFAIIFTLSKSMIQDAAFRSVFLLQLLVELLAAVGLGFVVWLILRAILSIKGRAILKKVLILVSGYLVYLFTNVVGDHSSMYLGLELHIEPLLICIIGGFLVTNYSIYRNDLIKIVKELGPYVYIFFFTLTGAMISLDVIVATWYITLGIFGVRILSLFLSSHMGTVLAGDPPQFRKIAWMAYITQAGVGIGLATIVAAEYEGWGSEFATIMIAVIVLNLLVGPPLFRWALHLVGEVHVKSDGTFDVERKVLIFGWENQSVALARQLHKQNWVVEFVVTDPTVEVLGNQEFKVHEYLGSDHLSLRRYGSETADTILCLLSDEMNYAILENAATALKPGGKFIFTTLNALFPLYHSTEDFINTNMKEGKSIGNCFDLLLSLISNIIQGLSINIKFFKKITKNQKKSFDYRYFYL